MGWATTDMGDLSRQVAVVTGANSGIGFEVAAALAGAGATVVLACRNPQRADAACVAIRERHRAAAVEPLRVDLADQTQIAEAAQEALTRFPRIDRLINNAGVLGVPRTTTTDGHEVVFGTNHLGHFALTGRLLPALLAAPQARVVTVSSLSQRLGRLRWDDLHGERRYSRAGAYARSKLANLLFALELQERLARAGAPVSSLAVHPGLAATEIGGRFLDRFPALKSKVMGAAERVLPPSAAAHPSLRAATDPAAQGGQFYGPGRLGGCTGPPVVVDPGRRARHDQTRRRLWAVSEELTGVVYRFE